MSIFILLIVFMIVGTVWLATRRRSNGPSAPVKHTQPDRQGQQAQRTEKRPSRNSWEMCAFEALASEGRQPDSVLWSTLQNFSDADGSEYADFCIGAYRDERLLRFVMRDYPELGYVPAKPCHSWDVPYDDVFAIILRERIVPAYLLDSPAADGSFRFHGPYYQTRLYRIGKGIELRLLDDSPDGTEPFDWLKANVRDPKVRFIVDSQERPVYGDRAAGSLMDVLDEYVHGISSRADFELDEASSRDVLVGSAERIDALSATAPKRARDYLGSAEYQSDIRRWFGNLKDANGHALAERYTAYAKTVLKLLCVGAIKGRYHAIFFYDHFPNDHASDAITETVKSELLTGIRLMMLRFNPSRS